MNGLTVGLRTVDGVVVDAGGGHGIVQTSGRVSGGRTSIVLCPGQLVGKVTSRLLAGLLRHGEGGQIEEVADEMGEFTVERVVVVAQLLDPVVQLVLVKTTSVLQLNLEGGGIRVVAHQSLLSLALLLDLDLLKEIAELDLVLADTVQKVALEFFLGHGGEVRTLGLPSREQGGLIDVGVSRQALSLLQSTLGGESGLFEAVWTQSGVVVVCVEGARTELVRVVGNSAASIRRQGDCNIHFLPFCKGLGVVGGGFEVGNVLESVDGLDP